MTQLLTERLVLRPMRHEDAEELHAVFSNCAAMRYWSTAPHRELSETRALVKATINADPAKTVDFAIEYQDRVIGKAGFWAVPEIGYILHPDYWGRGFGQEAVQAVVTHGFEVLNLPKIVADVDPDNQASINMLTKLGFVETGREEKTVKIGDQWFDSVYLALTAPT